MLDVFVGEHSLVVENVVDEDAVAEIFSVVGLIVVVIRVA